MSDSQKQQTIAILASAGGEAWCPETAETSGLGGSEEAIVYASQVLAKKGYVVHVYANPSCSCEHREEKANPRYFTRNDYETSTAWYDAALCWRATNFAQASKRARNVYFWPHDLSTHTISKYDLDHLNGVFYLTKFHQRDFLARTPQLSTIPSVIAGNGIIPEQFTCILEGKSKWVEERRRKKENQMLKSKKDYSCAYISNYGRGLDILLDLWPRIRSEYKEATLDIYYGRNTWGVLNEAQTKAIIKKIEDLKEQGVVEHGMVSHSKLAEELKTKSLLLYPSNTMSETFCISVVKAAAAGVICVTTRLAALAETVHPDAPTIPDVNVVGGKEAYLLKVLDTMKNIASHDRRKYIEWGLSFTWERVVGEWLKLMK